MNAPAAIDLADVTVTFAWLEAPPCYRTTQPLAEPAAARK